MRTALLLLLMAPMAAFAQFGAPPSVLPFQGAPAVPYATNNYSLFNQVGAYRPQFPMFQSAFPGQGIGGFYPQQPYYQSPFGMPQFGGMPFGGGFPQQQNRFGIGLNFNLGNLLSGLSNIDTSSRANEYDDEDDDYVPRHHRHHPRVVEDDEDDDGGRDIVEEERPSVTAAHLSFSRAPVATPFGVRPRTAVSLNIAQIERPPVYHYADDADAGVSSGEHIARNEDDPGAAILPPPPVIVSSPAPTRTVALPAAPRPAAAPAATHVAPAVLPYRPDPAPTKVIGQRPFDRRDPKSAPVYNVVMTHYRECQREGRVPMNCEVAEWGTFGDRPARHNMSCHPQGLAMDIGALRCGGVRIGALQSETPRGKPFHDMVACMETKMQYLWHNGPDRTQGHHDNFHLSNGCYVDYEKNGVVRKVRVR